MKLLAALAVALLLAPPVAAETRYATDVLTLPVRSGTSTGHKILRMVRSGTPLEVLERSEEGWSRVRTPEGTEGWILSRYLMEQPSARDRLVQAQERVATLEDENRGLREQAAQFEETQEALERCRGELEEIRRTASRTLAIEEQNLQLQQEVTEAREQLRAIEIENASLRDESSRKWFVAGASVALGSLLFGLIIPRIPWRRRRRWDQF